MYWIGYSAILLAAYFIGAVPCGFLIGRAYGKDIRKLGSGNIGATNVLRSVGKGPGRLCFLLDFLKGLLPVAAVRLLVDRGIAADPWMIAPLLAIAGTMLGHMYTCFLGFKGGKGVATGAGAVFALVPAALGCALAVWAAVFLVSRYVSLASIVAAAALPFLAWGYSALGWQPQPRPVLIFLAVVALLAILKHHSNIKRLIAGTENRFGRKEGA